MAILFRRSAKPIPREGRLGRLALVSLVGVTGFNTPFFRGLSLAPASDAGMIIPTMPSVFTADGRLHLLSARGSLRTVAGLAVSLGGAALFFGDSSSTRGAEAGRGGRALVGAAMCWAATSILSRPLSVRIGAMPTGRVDDLPREPRPAAGLLSQASPPCPWGRLTGRFWIVTGVRVDFPHGDA